MSEPSFDDKKAKLENHLKLLINQPLVEFQENTGVIVFSVEVRLNKEQTEVKNIESIKLYTI